MHTDAAVQAGMASKMVAGLIGHSGGSGDKVMKGHYLSADAAQRGAQLHVLRFLKARADREGGDSFVNRLSSGADGMPQGEKLEPLHVVSAE